MKRIINISLMTLLIVSCGLIGGYGFVFIDTVVTLHINEYKTSFENKVEKKRKFEEEKKEYISKTIEELHALRLRYSINGPIVREKLSDTIKEKAETLDEEDIPFSLIKFIKQL
jgi:hypothetical protein